MAEDEWLSNLSHPLLLSRGPSTAQLPHGSAVPHSAQSVVQGAASVLLGFVMDGSSYPARCQHFHFHGIAEAWLLKDRAVRMVVRL